MLGVKAVRLDDLSGSKVVAQDSRDITLLSSTYSRYAICMEESSNPEHICNKLIW